LANAKNKLIRAERPGHVERISEDKLYKMFIGKPERKKSTGKLRCKGGHYVRKDLK
jgi:hypothetical protein